MLYTVLRAPSSPTAGDNGLKNRPVWVRIPPRGPIYMANEITLYAKELCENIISAIKQRTAFITLVDKQTLDVKIQKDALAASEELLETSKTHLKSWENSISVYQDRLEEELKKRHTKEEITEIEDKTAPIDELEFRGV